MSESLPLCEKCGQPALVHITNEIGHEGVVRHYCIPCAAQQDGPPQRRDRRLNRGVVLILSGGFTLAFSLFADQFGFGRSPGFGWKQDIMLVLGFILIGAGTLIRASTLFLMGCIITILALLADWLRLGNRQGFGYEQAMGCGLGAVVLIAGILRVRQAVERPK